MANTFSFDINCKSGILSPNGNNSVTITVEDAERSDVMDLFDINDFLNHFGQEEIMKEMDESRLEQWAENNSYTKD